MKLALSFRPCEVKNGMISVAFNRTPNLCPTDHEVKNVADCQKALEAAALKLHESGVEPGTYYVVTREVGRKVNGYAGWCDDNRYVIVK